jgi:hypothetical protein
MARWLSKFNSISTIDSINSGLIVDKSGNFAGFNGNNFEHDVVLLEGNVKFSEELPSSEIRGMVWRACCDVAKKKHPITAQRVLNQISRYENDYLRKPYTSYKLVADISIGKQIGSFTTKLRGSTISLNPRLGKSHIKTRRRLLEDSKHMVFGELPTNYSTVSVSVEGRSVSEGMELAVERLNFIRSLWNLQINRSKLSRISGGRAQPVNKIILGPIHTIHTKNGELATENIWLDPRYQDPINPLDHRKMKNAREYEKKFKKCCREFPFEDVLFDVVQRYGNALDARDLSISLLELWSALEQLTNTLNKTYDVLIGRAIYRYTDHDDARQILEHIRRRRNELVHSAAGYYETETLVYQLKAFVEKQIGFTLSQKSRYRTLDEFCRLLDTSKNTSALESKIKLLKDALKYAS